MLVAGGVQAGRAGLRAVPMNVSGMLRSGARRGRGGEFTGFILTCLQF